MIDIENEKLLTPVQAVREQAFRNRSTGKPGHLSGFYRYVQRGVKDANGNQVKLETVRLPGGIVTSREAIQRFIERLNNPEAGPSDSLAWTPAAITRQQREVEEELDAILK
jgi:hypothetical protein